MTTLGSLAPLRFLEMPPELRNMVYRDLLNGVSEKYFAGSRKGKIDAYATGSRWEHIQAFLKLISTCKKIHHEAVQLLYGGIIFKFDVMSSMRKLLCSLGSMRARLRYMDIDASLVKTAAQHIRLREATSLQVINLSCTYWRGESSREVALA